MTMINKIRPILKKILSEKTYFLLRPIYRKLKYPINELIEFFKHITHTPNICGS